MDLYAQAGVTGLQSGLPGLHATPPAPLPFLNGMVVRSFLLERPAGNMLIYNAPGLSVAAEDIRRIGATGLLVNHWHEAMYGMPDLEVPIHVSEADRARTDLKIAGGFAEAEFGDDLQVIPAPGHTAGTTMFLWDSGAHRVLFTGDALSVFHGGWKAVVLGESDRAAYVATLERLMGLEFDFIVPWASAEDGPYGYGVTRDAAREMLGAVKARLEAGENG